MPWLVRRAGALTLMALPACQVLSGLDDYEITEGSGGGTSGCDPLDTGAIAPGEPLWVLHLGDSARQSPGPIASDPGTGDLVLVGEMAGSMVIGSKELISVDQSDVFVIKLDACGGLRWAHTLGGSGFQIGTALALAPDGSIYLAGHFSGSITLGGTTETALGFSDMFVAKLGPDGEPRWLRRFGGDGAELVNDVALHPNGEALALAGSFQSVVAFDAVALTSENMSDGFILVLNGDGGVITARGVHGPNDESAGALVYDAQGGLHVVGNFLGASIDFGDGPLVGGGLGDVALAAFDPAGTIVWSKAFSGDGVDFGADLGMLGSDVLVTGLFSGNVDFGAGPLTAQTFASDGFLALFDDAGNAVWSRDVGEDGNDGATGIAVDDDAQGAFVVGRCEVQLTSSSGAPLACVDGDPFLIRVDGDGTYEIAAEALYGAGDAKALHVAVTAGGHPVVSGDFVGQLTVGDETLAARGQEDVFVARLLRK